MALKRERNKLHDMTASSQCFKPIPQLIGQINRHLEACANYFSIGYSRVALREINTYVRDPSRAALETAQPAALPTAGRDDLLWTASAYGVDLLVSQIPRSCLCRPQARVF